MWKNSKEETPKEVYTYGRESDFVLIATKPYGQWEYSIAYCAYTESGICWVGSHGEINKELEIFWKDIEPPKLGN